MSGPSTELTALQRAVVAMKDMRRRIETLEGARVEPVAVVGMACRFPGGADTPEAFWRLLLDGVDTVEEVPPDRWDVDAYYHPDPDRYGTMNTRFGSFLHGIDFFDPHFFGMSEHEATSIDPQHRLLMEVAWEALERACIPPSALEESRTGVFVGITAMEYIHLLSRARAVNAYYVGGAPLCAASGRLSHLFGLQGPSMSIDTACSSALVSVHQACQSLRAGESDLALAGGVNLTLTPHGTVFLSRAHMLAPDGRCKTFSADADGFVRGEGCALLVLRRLSDAEASGDPIRGVVLGSAVNHDGPSNGFTAPNGRSQERLIRQALENAQVESREIDFVETHGTGTALGDPIEVEALGRALCPGRSSENPLYLGAVKTNLGHLESAAGAAGLMKALLAVEEGQIPGNLHQGEPNPYIEWNRLPVEVPVKSAAWPTHSARPTAGVSAFGATGTNAHIVVARTPRPSVGPGVSKDRDLHLLPLSARSPGALEELADRYARYLAENPRLSFSDICFSAGTGRDHFEHRLAILAPSSEAAREELAAFAAGRPGPGVLTGVAEGPRSPGVGFLLRGEALPPDLLASLLELPGFLREYEDCRTGQAASNALDLFSGEYALARLWRSWGAHPAMVAGMGAGVQVAGTLAGVLSARTGARTASGFPPEAGELQPPKLPILSMGDGAEIPGTLLRDPEFWTAPAAEAPDPALPDGVRRVVDGFRAKGVGVMITTGEGWKGSAGDPGCIASRAPGGLWPTLLDGLARLYVRSVRVDWAAVDEGFHRRKVLLPTYPFQRIRCWPVSIPFTGSDPGLLADSMEGGESAPHVGSATGSGEEGAPNDLGEILARQLEATTASLLKGVEEQISALMVSRRPTGAGESAPSGTPPLVRVTTSPAPATSRRLSMGGWHLLMLAGDSQEEVDGKAREMVEGFETGPAAVLEPRTDGSQSASGPHRRIVVFHNPEEAVLGLERPTEVPRRTAAGVAQDQAVSVSFMLPGLGDHYVGMAKGLYDSTAGFRRRLDRCAALLEPELGVDIREGLFADEGGDGDSEAPVVDLARMLGRAQPPTHPGGQGLNEIVHAHSAIFSVEYALAGLWGDWGVAPQALLGFSLGEIVGATLAGVMSLKDALTLVARRARVIDTLPRGAMLAVISAPDELSPYLDDDLTLAALCAPRVQVVAGSPESISRLEASLAQGDLVSRRLRSDFAFHTGAMAGQEALVRELARGFRLRPPTIPLCSNTSGRWLAPDEATDPGYWARHTMLPVRFGDGVARLLETDHQVIIEVGPGQSLTSFALQSHSLDTVSKVEFLPSLRSRHETEPDAAVFLRSVGRLWLNGIDVSQPEEED